MPHAVKQARKQASCNEKKRKGSVDELDFFSADVVVVSSAACTHPMMQRVPAAAAHEPRPQERGNSRERAALSLAAAYAEHIPSAAAGLRVLSPPSPSRTANNSSSRRGNASWRPRPGSAKSTSSRPQASGRGAAGRISSARSSCGWGGGGGDDDKLRLGFELRREAAARGRMRGVSARGGRESAATGGGINTLRVVDLEELEDENHRLKLALNRATEETKTYRVNGVRLEGELLRADGNVEILLAELDQAPSKR